VDSWDEKCKDLDKNNPTRKSRGGYRYWSLYVR
jgi:hypothetical protein